METLKNDVVELVIEVPKIILLDYTPLRAVPGEQSDTRQRRGGPRVVPHRCVWGAAKGSSGGSWVLNTTSGTPREGITASPGGFLNTGQG